MARRWVAKGRPTSDNEYFEALTLNIFRAGLDWRMVEKKWPAIRGAFADPGSEVGWCGWLAEIEPRAKVAPFEPLGHPSKWVTLHALRMLKRLYE